MFGTIPITIAEGLVVETAGEAFRAITKCGRCRSIPGAGLLGNRYSVPVHHFYVTTFSYIYIHCL